MKAKRSLLNLGFGLTSQVITIILGFFIPRLIMVNYGSEANGLIASIVQIISYFALLEAGVGAASLQALYKPIASNDRGHINSILAATSRYYKKRECTILSPSYCLQSFIRWSSTRRSTK